jgi:hypothetical protein
MSLIFSYRKIYNRIIMSVPYFVGTFFTVPFHKDKYSKNFIKNLNILN